MSNSNTSNTSNTSNNTIEEIVTSIQKELSQYWVSSLGFLPEECTTSIVSNPNLNWINEIALVMAENISGTNIDNYIDNLPEYNPELHSIDGLTDGECQFAYSILTMLDNRQRWAHGVEHVKELASQGDVIIPTIIGATLYRVSERIQIAMAVTHAGVDLWNWHLKNPTLPFSLDNIDCNYLMTGNNSEAWFYKVMIAIEGIGGRSLPLLYTIIKLIEKVRNDEYDMDVEEVNKTIIFMMQSIHNDLVECTAIIKRMYEQCDPEFFFNNLRIYLAGTINDNLPNNVKVDLGEEELTTIAWKGGSAAQSTLIQVFDRFLGIEHRFESHGGEDTPCGAFLQDMHNYMPKKHREFLSLFENNDFVQYFIESGDVNLISAYNDFVDQLVKFRSAHLGLIYRYIMAFIPQPEEEDTDVNDNNDSNNAHGAKGSGGTDPVVFLKEIIEDTKRAKINCPYINSMLSSNTQTRSNSTSESAMSIYLPKMIVIASAMIIVPTIWYFWRS